MFSEVKLFQVKPDKVDVFEALIQQMLSFQKECEGCHTIRYVKRSHVFDTIQQPPRPLKKIIKSVKYLSYWEFETINQYAEATKVFFELFEKQTARCLLVPFDIYCGENQKIIDIS